MDSDIQQYWPAVNLLRENPLARSAFQVVMKNVGISGYGIARELNQNPTLVKAALSALLENQLISGSAALTANFALTGTGFGVKDLISGHPELWTKV